MCVNADVCVILERPGVACGLTYSGCSVRRPSFADQQVNNVQVVVVHSDMKWSQTIL